MVGPVLKTSIPPPDILDQYKIDYGYLGPMLHTTVTNLRKQNDFIQEKKAINMQ